jgi:sugar (pentulose or hexulose) kinase
VHLIHKTKYSKKIGDNLNEYIIGLDLGTTALKISLFDNEGKVKGLSTQEYNLITPKPNWVEEDVEVYWHAFKKGLEQLRSRVKFNPDEIKALGFSAQGETLIFLGHDGKPLSNAIVWLDNRAIEQAEIFRKKFGDTECYRVTGQVSFEACWPASKILWLKQNNKALFEKVFKFLLIEDYFIYRMCGKFVAEGSLLC